MLSFLRGRDPPRRSTAYQNPVYYEDSTSWQQFNAPGSEYLLTHGFPKKSFFNPPLHLHLFQSEVFRCVRGTGIWYQPTAKSSEQRIVKKAGDPPIFLPVGTFHRFENASESEILVVDIKINPETSDAVMEERFFRNFFGYLEDCRVAGTAPSIFQLELFLWSVDGPLAIPIPGPNWLKWWASRVVMYSLGKFVGEALLGYKHTYAEYYSGRYIPPSS